MAFLFAGSATSSAQDQGEPPYDSSIQVQLFEYALGPKTFLTVSDADVLAKNLFTLDFLVTYLTNPFTIYNVDPNQNDITTERTRVVKSLLAGEITAAYGIAKDLQVGLALPVALINGDGLNPNTAMPSMDELGVAGLGDARLEIKSKLWASGDMRLAAALGATIPTSVGSGGGDYLGDNLAGRARVSLQWSRGKMSAGANLGAIVGKERKIYSSSVGRQLTYGGAGAYQVNDRFSGVLEIFGRSGLGNLDLDASPLELNGGVRIKAGKSMTVLVGGGGGLVHGIGSPDVRGFVSVGWAPDYRDDDGDGLRNLEDRCPLLAEDKDGFEDEDGCPDDDNDGDRREDAVDKCPNRAEDIDGFQDEDGCPEIDNDEDGVNDIEDRCPKEAEDGVGEGGFATDGCPASKTDSDVDGVMDDKDQCVGESEDADSFEDWDGCPDADNDKDGVADEADQCPICAEDKDGFEDEDGCPDLDNDRDGVADADDQCANEAETLNGFKDGDGCPDRGDELASFDGQRLLFKEQLRFNRRNRLRSKSADAVNVAALIIKAHPEVTQWMILAAAPRGRDEEAARQEAQRWANVIKAQLLMNGVESDRVTATGAVSDAQGIVILAKERAEASDDPSAFACPAPLQAKERPQPPPEAAAMPAESSEAAPASEEAASEAASGEAASGEAASGEAASGEAASGAAEAPADSAPAAPATVPEVFKEYSGVVESVRFRRNRSRLRRGEKTLDKVAELLKAHPHVHLEVGAHTDSRKGPEKSRKITQAQADEAVKYLVEKGVPAEQLEAVGYGMDKPIADNDRSRGRAKNRRVEFTFTVK